MRRPDRRQVLLEPIGWDERLPAEHALRTVRQGVERLDLSDFYKPIAARGSDPGRPATDPRLRGSLWLYAAVDGVGNGRKLDRLCRVHDAYKWLCGGVSLNDHTLNDFRVGHEKLLDELFTQVLPALTSKGVVKVERIRQDSQCVRASAGSSSFHREATLQRRLKEVQDYVKELKRPPDEPPGESTRRRAARERGARERQQRLQAALALLPTLQKAREHPHTNKKKRDRPLRVSRTDPEAQRMRMGDGGTRPAYSMPLAADPGSGAIVGVEVVDTPADPNQSEPLRQQVERRTKCKVKEHLMDQGYVGIQQIDAAEQAGVAVYAPLPKGKDGRPVTAGRRDGVGTQVWRARLQTEEAKAIDKQRLPASERVNAEFQERLGLRCFAVRGMHKVRCVTLWSALAYHVIHFAPVLLA